MSDDMPDVDSDPSCERLASRQLVVAAWILTLLLVTHTLYMASSLLVPLTVSLLTYLAMRPVVCRMKRAGIPAWFAAGLVTLFFGGAVVTTAQLIAPQAQYWAGKGPESLAAVASKLKTLKQPLEAFDTAEQHLEQLTETSDSDAPLKVEVSPPAIIDKKVLFSGTGQLLAFLMAVGVTSFFLLASDDAVLRRILKALPTLGDRKKALSLVLDLQEMIGSYLAQITLINFSLGCAVALMTWACGMPTPLLWGVVAMLLNFIPFVGALIGATVVFLAAAIHVDQLLWPLIITGFYLTLTGIEAHLITPTILGKTMQVGPVLVLMAVAFWGFLWGLPGVIVAVPMLMVVREVCCVFQTTRPIAIILGEDFDDDCVQERSEEDDSETDRSDQQAIPAPHFPVPVTTTSSA